MGVPAEELTQAVRTGRGRLAPEGGGDAAREPAIAELVDVLHRHTSITSFTSAKSASVRCASAGSTRLMAKPTWTMT